MGSRGIALLFLDHGTRRGEGSASRPGHSLPSGKRWYALYRRLGRPQGRSGEVRKISPRLGFDPWTVQPVASRYTDQATRPTIPTVISKYFKFATFPKSRLFIFTSTLFVTPILRHKFIYLSFLSSYFPIHTHNSD